MTLSELIRGSAARHPRRTAFVFREKSWTYAEFYERTLAVARGLESAGIAAGDRVALLSKNSIEFPLTVFALSHIGAAAVPANFFLKPEELVFILNNCGAAGIVLQPAFLESVLSVRRDCPALKRIWVTDRGALPEDAAVRPFSELELGGEEAGRRDLPAEQDTALILYTSGTTGRSKGAMLSHANLTSNALSCAQALEIRARDRFLLILPMFHVFAWTTNVLVPLAAGAKVVIVESIRPPKPWLKLMFKHGITCFTAVPQVYSVLADQAQGLKRWLLRWLFFARVRLCISGAAPLLPETKQRFERAVGRPLLQGYGLTETSPVTNVNTLKQRREGSVGRALPGVGVKVVDENERELPAGQEGEICISGPCVMRGYYGLEEETKKSFTRDGWLKTGDVGRIDADGYLFIEDRIKDMIIVKGLKVFSIQVEEVLLSHPAVAEAAVVGVPTPTGDEIVRAFVVLKEGAGAGKTELARFCHEKLPPYKRPRDIEILKELPKNALQKVLKRELRKRSVRP